MFIIISLLLVLAVVAVVVVVVAAALTKIAQSQLRAFRATHSALVNCRLVTTCYGFPIVAEQELHLRPIFILRFWISEGLTHAES